MVAAPDPDKRGNEPFVRAWERRERERFQRHRGHREGCSPADAGLARAAGRGWPGSTVPGSHRPPAAALCAIPVHRFGVLLWPYCFLHTHRHTRHKTHPTIPLLCIPRHLDREGTSSSRLLFTHVSTSLSSAIFLLILTFWYPVKCSLKTPNYASHLLSVQVLSPK